MKLLILPSHRILYYHGKMLLTLLPEYIKAQQYKTLSSPPLSLSSSSLSPSSSILKQQNNDIIALFHYKDVKIYQSSSIIELAQKIRNSTLDNSHIQIKPIIEELFNKKIQVLDLYHTYNTFINTKQKMEQGQGSLKLKRQCVFSDKFGQLQKLVIPNLQQQKQGVKSPPIQINSNLGIPKFIKHITIHPQKPQKKQKQYYILADQQNRIKIYNTYNPHELVSVWFMVNMYAVQCDIIYPLNQHHQQQHENKDPLIILLQKYYNKLTLEHRIQVQYFIANQSCLEADQYPGKSIQLQLQKQNNVDLTTCKYYTMLTCNLNYPNTLPQHQHLYTKNTTILFYLYNNKIIYEVIQIPNLNSPTTQHKKIQGQVQIQDGKWDYLYVIEIQSQENTFIIAYGCDVQNPVQICPNTMGEGVQVQNVIDLINNHVSLNKYEKVLKLVINL